MVGVTDGNIPTFAIQTSSGAYETVFDYTDSYDLAIVQAILSRGYTSDFRDAFVKSLNTVFANPESYTLVLDCFGNICTQIDGTYRVIVPAAANQYLTQTPSINLVNSLIFNASTNTVGASQIINKWRAITWWVARNSSRFISVWASCLFKRIRRYNPR